MHLPKAEKSRPDAETILSQAQHKVHDKMVWFWSCCHPEPCPELDSGLFRDLGFEFWVLKPRPVGGVLCSSRLEWFLMKQLSIHKDGIAFTEGIDRP
jgi:hypothetical protein